jgi:membrane protease YdiL (CAAX protease family)
MSHSTSVLAKRYPIIAFFFLAFGISWFFWIPIALSSQGILPFQIPFFLFVLAGYGPSLSGIIMAGIKEGKPGIRELFERLLIWRIGAQYYVFVLFSTALVVVCAMALYPLFSGETIEIDLLKQLRSLLLLLPVIIFLGGPMSEELGWRGFALPGLLSRYSALAASLIVGVMWGLWHLPAFWIAGAGQHNQPIFWFMIGAPAVAILYTWVYNHTKGSLLIAVLYHTAFNSTMQLALPAFPTAKAVTIAFMLTVALLWVMAIIIVAVYGPQHLSRKGIFG